MVFVYTNQADQRQRILRQDTYPSPMLCLHLSMRDTHSYFFNIIHQNDRNLNCYANASQLLEK